MMYHVAIVEDEDRYADQLEDYLKQYEQESIHGFQVKRFRDGEGILYNYKPIYDLILMDIEMPMVDGMSAAERIRGMDRDVVIIFITNMAQYAIRGYAVDALDYVLKPVNYFAFSQSVKRALERINNKKQHYIVLSARDGKWKLNTSDILYIESRGHTLTYYTKTREYIVTGSMKEMEESLKKYGFSRCNNGYLVNLEHVDAIQKGSAVVNGNYLQISRGKKEDFMNDLAFYMGGSEL